MIEINKLISTAINEKALNKDANLQKFNNYNVLYHWEKIVGKDIALQSIPVNIENKILFVAVNNSVWCQHLSMLKADIIYKINKFAGVLLVEDLKFRNQYYDKSKRAIVDKKEYNLANNIAQIKLTKEENDKVNELTATITDEKLRKSIKKLMVKNLAFNKIKVDNNWHKCLNCDTLCSKQEQYCTVCKIQRKAEKASKIRKLLIEAPWLTYAELNSYENCTSKEFINEKIILLNYYADLVANNKDNKIYLLTLVMLFNGAKMEEINDNLIQKTLTKFRRKK